MDGVELMNRMDTKFMLHERDLLHIVRHLPTDYRILEVNGLRGSHYETLYYDTPDFLFYRRHHSGKKNRLKIRKRSYVESGQTYLEVKFKSNKDRTIKDRTKVQGLALHLEERADAFITRETGLHYDLEPKLYNRFVRSTFVRTEGPERITIDTGLSFYMNDRHIELPGLVIIEVKQSRSGKRSPFMECIKKAHIRPESFSKYCLGAALLFPELKQNIFKEKIKKIQHITYGMDHTALT